MPTTVSLQHEWNLLVAAARGRGMGRGLRNWSQPAWTVEYGQSRVNWLRARLGETTASTPVQVAVGVAADTGLPNYTFGIEIECYLPVRGETMYTLAAKITAAGVVCQAETYNHSVRTHWKIITDGSLNDYRRGIELVSPILQGEEGLRQVRKVCDVISVARCTVRQSCGLHVHIGVRDESFSTFTNLARNYQKFESVIDSVLAPSRRGRLNNYCQPVSFNLRGSNGSSVQTFLRQFTNRFMKVNFAAFWRHGTVEFRQHQGTVNADKAEQWTRFCLRMVAACKQQGEASDTTAVSLDGLMGYVGATEAEKAFFVQRQIEVNRPTATARAA